MRRIVSVWACIWENPGDGEEGIASMTDLLLGTMPLICTDESRVPLIKHAADRIALHTKRPYKLKRFDLADG